jgi:hypothetical protein
MTEPEWICHEPDAEWPCAQETGGRPGHHPRCGPTRTVTGSIVLIGDHASDHLVPGDFYDIDEWRQFLAGHHFNINDVYRIDRNADGSITVYQWRRDHNGRSFLDNSGQPATADPVTVTPRQPVPVWS